VDEAKNAGKDVDLVVVGSAGDAQAQIRHVNNLVPQRVSAHCWHPCPTPR
jgi:ABC-type sugar transport system substrate-binding protein